MLGLWKSSCLKKTGWGRNEILATFKDSVNDALMKAIQKPYWAKGDKMNTLRDEIETAINRNSAENGSNTPDFILAEYLTDCLAAFDKASRAREKWFGEKLSIDGGVTDI